jgi:hypothetical protein
MSLFFGVAVFIWNTRKERRKATLDYWDEVNQEIKSSKRELKGVLGSSISSEQAQELLTNSEHTVKVNRLLNIYERIALRVELKDFDIKMLNQLTGANFIAAYEGFQPYIELRRESLSRPFAWIEFERVVQKLQKLREKANK